MVSRLVAILVIVTAQLAAGRVAVSANDACVSPTPPERMACCGEDCCCTPDSCPCMRPAHDDEQIPTNAPPPAPPRIDLFIATNALRAASPTVVAGVVNPAPCDDIHPAERAKLRARLGVWTT